MCPSDVIVLRAVVVPAAIGSKKPKSNLTELLPHLPTMPFSQVFHRGSTRASRTFSRVLFSHAFSHAFLVRSLALVSRTLFSYVYRNRVGTRFLARFLAQRETCVF